MFCLVRGGREEKEKKEGRKRTRRVSFSSSLFSLSIAFSLSLAPSRKKKPSLLPQTAVTCAET